MQPSTLELFRDILRETEFLMVQTAQTNLAAFIADELKKRAFVRSIEIIGEAAKKIPQEIRATVRLKRPSDVAWRKE